MTDPVFNLPGEGESATPNATPPLSEPAVPNGPSAAGAFLPLIVLLLLALIVRVMTVHEPLNSDDQNYIYGAELLLNHHHPLDYPIPPSTQAKGRSHHFLRLGMILPVTLLTSYFGSNFITYYTLPLLSSLLAIALSYLVLRKFIGVLPAILAALVQIVNPMEISHASILLADMPVAALSLAYFALFLYYGERKQNVWSRLAVGCLGGAILIWIHFMRENALVFLGPIFLVLLIRKQSRMPVAVGLALTLAAILGEQFLYMSRGAEFGYRFHVVKRAFQDYLPHLTVYTTFRDYLLGYPRYIVRSNGQFFGVLFYIGIFSHFYVFLAWKDWLLKAFCVSGLFSLAAFWFCLFAPLSKGYVTEPPMMRFIQFFLSTSVVCIPLALVHFNDRWLGGIWRKMFEPRRRMLPARVAGFLIFLAVFVTMGCSIGALPGRLLAKDGGYYPILKALYHYAEKEKTNSLEIRGLGDIQGGVTIFTWLPLNKKITWIPTENDKLRDLSEKNPNQLFLANLQRTRWSLEYVRDAGQKKIALAKYTELEKYLKNDMDQIASSPVLILTRSRGAAALKAVSTPSRATSAPSPPPVADPKIKQNR